MSIWNPWHGCHKISPGCKNCYVYRRDESVGRDAGNVMKTGDYNLPMKRNRQKQFKLLPEGGTVYTCMTSDFFLEEADPWRDECWQMMQERKDLHFTIITKRIHRFMECIPDDWGDGYPNVTICCTCEDQERADYRLPIFLSLPIRHRNIIHEPMLGPIRIEKYLESGDIDLVICGGESGNSARPCSYEWILETRKQCIRYHVAFRFKQTGALFVKDGKAYHIERKDQESQAQKAGIDYEGESGGDIAGAEKARISHEDWLKMDLFERIAQSEFRSRFRLKQDDKEYVINHGTQKIRHHAEDFIRKRLAPAVIINDGKQTPMKGHPVFLAQHGCGCCCRGCLEKWHGIPQGTELSEEQQQYIVDIIMEWILRQM